MFSHTEKTDTSLEMTKETFCLFLGMPLLSGFHKLPDRKMYCKANPDIFVQAMSDSMPRYNFGLLLRNLRLCDNE